MCLAREDSPHSPVFEDFKSAPYVDRYNVLCKKSWSKSGCTALLRNTILPRDIEIWQARRTLRTDRAQDIFQHIREPCCCRSGTTVIR
ncbi:MAG: hypothetical protein EPO55_24715 [Reyranella sp.]|uniref:PaeR7I family type II restriction endonuclease n=1 Tax=Reyranella sp. TaxID=1929291 RepID=UPI001221C5BA|nr:MAG: hypothetical protein EPO55_24715 [Reyranella sp.]